MIPIRPLAFAAAALLFSAAVPAAQAAEPVLTPHRGVYDLSLDGRRATRGIDTARGRILFETNGNLCEGYTTSFRQVVELVVNGNQVVMDVRTANFEEGDGTGFRFTSRSTENGAPRDETDGNATRAAGTIRIAVTKPRPVNSEIDGQTIFPTEHLRRIIDAARAGQSILEVKVYDGAETGEKLYNATAVIGRRIEPGAGSTIEAAARDPRLMSLARWPVTISYFEAGKESATPAYSIAFELYENGVSRQLVVNYGEFSLRGTLTKIDWLTENPCSR
ncbi:cell envelope integrity EipB family protein [Phreatobacter stygius]|nr:cell envelope integrity EipB family protein [Phreatobacter stygius]